MCKRVRVCPLVFDLKDLKQCAVSVPNSLNNIDCRCQQTETSDSEVCSAILQMKVK